jgi:hypothetical protein
MENSDSVKVFVRLRPPQLWEANSPAKNYIDQQNSSDNVLILDSQPFVFDHIFHQSASQEEVFNKMVSLIVLLLHSYFFDGSFVVVRLHQI